MPATSTQPFVRLEGILNGAKNNPYDGVWRVVNGATFYDAGSFEIDPATNRFSAVVPLRNATNTIRYNFVSVQGTGTMGTMAVNVVEFTYSFAEGATGNFFDTEITLANPGGSDAPSMNLQAQPPTIR